MYFDGVIATLKISLSEISLDFLKEYVKPAIVLWEESFKLNDMYNFHSQRTANIWIEDQKLAEPLERGTEYELMANVDNSIPFSESLKNNNANDTREVIVSASGDGFEIPENTKRLILPKSGNSDSVSFKIIPKFLGNHRIEIFFYYKLNLLMILSAPLQIVRPVYNSRITYNISGFASQQKFLNVEVIGSSDKEFESIFEIDRLGYG